MDSEHRSSLVSHDLQYGDYPRCSMYGIFTYIWVIFRVNVGKYSSTMEHLGMVTQKIKSYSENVVSQPWYQIESWISKSLEVF